MEKKTSTKKSPAKAKQEQRRQSLEQALRDNLKRRKQPSKTKDTASK